MAYSPCPILSIDPIQDESIACQACTLPCAGEGSEKRNPFL